MPPTAGWRRAWLGAQSPSSPRPQAAHQALEGHPEAPEAKAWEGRLRRPVLADRLWGAGTSVAMQQENSGWGHAHFARMAIPWPAALEPGPPARPLPEYPRLSRQRGANTQRPCSRSEGCPYCALGLTKLEHRHPQPGARAAGPGPCHTLSPSCWRGRPWAGVWEDRLGRAWGRRTLPGHCGCHTSTARLSRR